jgi:FKBP-type peptidyl-prolyl cis-trans isomerase FkpA
MKSIFQIIATLSCALFLTACGGSDDEAAAIVPVTMSKADLAVGTGNEAINGNLVTVAYTGWLYDSTATGNKGAKFDEATAASPFTFQLGKGVGEGAVIAGWDQGVVGMRVGGKRLLVIPPGLAYGAQAHGSIPANSTLVFEIEVLAIKP